MKERLYRVALTDTKSGNKLALRVWAKCSEEATHKLCGVVNGPYCEYTWRGTGPEYDEQGHLIEREIKS